MVVLDYLSEKAKKTILLIVFISPFIGHFLAHNYYSGFGIDYFRFSNWVSGVEFLFEHFDSLLDSALIASILYLIVLTILSVIGGFFDFSVEGDKGYIKNLKGLYFFLKYFSVVYFFIFITTMLMVYDDLSSEELVNVDMYLFSPYKVYLKNDEVLECVKPLGSVGGFKVYSKPNFRVIINEDDILKVSPMASSHPSYEFYVSDDEQRAIWDEFIISNCSHGDYPKIFSYKFREEGFIDRVYKSLFPELPKSIPKPEIDN